MSGPMAQRGGGQTYAAMDILKLVMAVLVVGIHTEPLGFNLWLDRGFGIVTRLCVPFFFVASSYFYFRKEGGAWAYIRRLLLLYGVWSLIYLPLDIPELATMSPVDIAVRYLWAGNEHALWYLWGSVIGFAILYGLTKIADRRVIAVIALVVLLWGCTKSTWAPLFENLLPFGLPDWLGARNGLFYAFPYYTLGMLIAQSDTGRERPPWVAAAGLGVSMLLLAAESVLFVVGLHTESTVLWISVLPAVYFLFRLALTVRIPCTAGRSRYLRKLSTLIYVSHGLFLIAFDGLPHMLYFSTVLVASVVLSAVVIGLERLPACRWLCVFH